MLRIKSLPTNNKHILPPLALLIVALICLIFDSNLAEALIYNRSLINDGQYWRLVTGHVFHTNDNHFFLNASALILLWALHGQYYTYRSYTFAYLVCALMCSVGMFWYSPEIDLYVGLSGVLHGFFIFGALKDIQDNEKTGYLLLIGVIAKLAHEQLYGANSEVEALVNASVAIDAHLYGAIGGALAFITLFLFKKFIVKA